jgi:hypothetical protein
LVVVVPAAASATARGDIINFDTGLNSNWKVSGAGAIAATPFYQNQPLLSITSNTFQSGTFVTGGTLANFTGLWDADFQFALPSNASNVSLNFSNLTADDRVVMQLNGNNIGDFFLNGVPTNPPLVGQGIMQFPSGLSVYTFTGQTSGTVTSGFLSGLNDIRLVVNNTNTANLFAPAITFGAAGDGTNAGVLGTVNFTTQVVPEPASLSVLAFGFAGLMRRRLRKPKSALSQR